MAAPSYVPADPREHPRDYESSPRRGNPWPARRPGEMVGREMPAGGLYGNQGPDIGYAYKLVHLVTDKIELAGTESLHDAEAGGLAVAMRRAALFGRAPVLADLDVAFTLWGFYDSQPPSGLRVLRAEMFEGAASPLQGYALRREIANVVSEHALRMTPQAVEAAYRSDWAGLFIDR